MHDSALDVYRASAMFTQRIASDPRMHEGFVHFVRSGMHTWVHVPTTAVTPEGVVVWRFTEWFKPTDTKIILDAQDAAGFTRYVEEVLKIDVRDVYVCLLINMQTDRLVVPYILDPVNDIAYDVNAWDGRACVPVTHALSILPQRFACLLFLLNGAPRCVGSYSMNRIDFM